VKAKALLDEARHCGLIIGRLNLKLHSHARYYVYDDEVRIEALFEPPRQYIP
jgi:hypothetical protein